MRRFDEFKSYVTQTVFDAKRGVFVSAHAVHPFLEHPAPPPRRR